jgi:hypothetical protein
MRFPLSISVLLLGLAPMVLAQDTTTVSLADVARQSRAHAGAPAKSWDDQNSDFGRSTADSGTPCGAPIPEVPNGFVSGLIGQPVKDPNVAKALERWLSKHPDLDLIHPDELAKMMFPRTPAQAQENQSTAHMFAQHWLTETAEVAATGNPNEINSAINSVMSTSLRSNAGDLLSQAVAAEEQRRVRSDGSEGDKVQEAVNLYSICESRRQQQFEGEVDKLAKAEFQKDIKEVAERANAQNPQNGTANGL